MNSDIKLKDISNNKARGGHRTFVDAPSMVPVGLVHVSAELMLTESCHTGDGTIVDDGQF